MNNLKKLEKRIENLEALVKEYMSDHLRYHQHVRGSLAKIEANSETQVGLVEKYLEEVSHLRTRVALLATLHRNELGLFDVDVEKWLKPKGR